MDQLVGEQGENSIGCFDESPCAMRKYCKSEHHWARCRNGDEWLDNPGIKAQSGRETQRG